MISLWSAIILYFNSHLGNVIKRKYAIKDLIEAGFNIEYRKTTFDTYRNYLTKAGYLKQIRRGEYLIVKEIPIDLSIGDVKSQAYYSEYINGFFKRPKLKPKKSFIKEKEFMI